MPKKLSAKGSSFRTAGKVKKKRSMRINQKAAAGGRFKVKKRRK